MLRSHEVLVWRLNLEDGHTTALRKILTNDEILKSQKLRLENKRNAFTTTRGFLRSVLSKITNVPAEALEFTLGPHGKPRLLQAHNAQNISFNVSHSGCYALVAMALGAEVGIDVENIRAGRDIQGLAETVFCDVELSQFYSLSASEQIAAFHIAWTRKEALVKALGRGLSLPLKNFAVSLDPDGSRSVLWHAPGYQNLASYRFHPIPMPDHEYRAALVTTTLHTLVHIYDWRGAFPD